MGLSYGTCAVSPGLCLCLCYYAYIRFGLSRGLYFCVARFIETLGLENLQVCLKTQITRRCLGITIINLYENHARSDSNTTTGRRGYMICM